jgi:hypothetical protein
MDGYPYEISNILNQYRLRTRKYYYRERMDVYPYGISNIENQYRFRTRTYYYRARINHIIPGFRKSQFLEAFCFSVICCDFMM